MEQAKDFCNDIISNEKLSALVSYFENYNIEYTSSRDGETNNLDKVKEREEVVQLEEMEGYMIFKSVEEFKKIQVDKIISIDDETIKLPQNLQINNRMVYTNFDVVVPYEPFV